MTYLIFYLQFNPIDTNKYPTDIKILKVKGNEKTVIREKHKGISNQIIKDTVTVQDIVIFRKIISKNN
ncbi:hypothetical protein HX088_13585 [Empedobacter sp. 225-1]|uniref:hypothetical protein n=1 Tax=unclassified Empedobacter TaxID=2643773 RepID=UPI002576E98C|nr:MULTISPECIES: hypothetical protein [unclassified Empedobacter]MDM1524282.1 hypothetical protein [Empedobacter sp. 225-1]MDM1544200.1 hypothetical protein [Empedobacter sp. 189-2]